MKLFFLIPVTQEAVSTGDPELLQLCLQHRDHQRFQKRTEGVPGLLERLKQVCVDQIKIKHVPFAESQIGECLMRRTDKADDRISDC